MSNDLLTQLADYGRYHREEQRSIQTEEVGVELAKPTPRRSPPRPWLVAAMTAAAVLALLGPLALFRDGLGPSATTHFGTLSTGIPDGAPLPGSVAPYVEAPPLWFGEPAAGLRDGADRMGRWVSAALGVESGDGQVSSPISISVTDGTHRGFADAEEIVIDGQTLRLFGFGGWQALATAEEPTILVSGAVDVALLSEVLNATTVVATTAGDSLAIRLPAGYVMRVAPQLQAEDVPRRRSLTNAAGDVSINEISDWVEPELAAAAGGADYQPVDIDGIDGWTGRHEFNPYGPLTFLVWSPQPGVVFEIVTTSDQRSTEQLVELAAATNVISAAEWDQAFGR